MGNPRGRGSRVFGDVHHYDVLPPAGAKICIGVDFAYSTRTSADWSVAVVVAESGGAFYVLDVVRVRAEPREFRERVRLLAATYPGASVCAYAAATERGGIEFFRDGGLDIDGRTATADKFSRAIPTAAAWNTGKILLPRSTPWLTSFVSEVCGFTGVKDRHDDQVDALAAAFDGVLSIVPASTYVPRIWTTGGYDNATIGFEDSISPNGGGFHGSSRITGGGRMNEIEKHFTDRGMTRAA
jgi:predicted phage terminase large subunit-like protein